MNNYYPRGKLNDSDEGATPITVYQEDKTVIIDFGREVSWIGLDKQGALTLAQFIIAKANEINIED